MYHLFKLFLDILLLRKGPQALPDSRFLLGSVLALHFLVGITLSAFSLPFGQALGAALVGTTLVVALIQAVLMMRHFAKRITRTATAVAGAELLLGLGMLPFTAWEAAGGNSVVASIVVLVMLGWNFAVNAHIFRHALDTTPPIGAVTAFLYMLVSLFVADLLTGTGA